MLKKIPSIVGNLLVIATACFGQSSFQGLTAGQSTRNEVARVLGQPVRTVDATHVEYAPPVGIAKIEAEYRAGSDIVERIEVYFVRPISRAALLQKFSLPQQADATKTNEESKLAEYFDGAALLVLTYATADPSSGVSRIGYYSRESFNSLTANSPPSTPSPMGASNKAIDAFAGTNSSGDSSINSGPSWTIPTDTVLIAQMISSITSKNAKPGDQISASVIAPISVDGRVIIPARSLVEGRVTQVAPAKRMSTPGMIAVGFDQLVFANGSRAKIVGILTSVNAEERQKIDSEGRVSSNSGKRTVVFIGGGAGVGAAIGAISSGGRGAAIGSAAGAAAGVAAAMLLKGPEAEIKQGLQFGIQLSRPLIVRESFLGEKQ